MENLSFEDAMKRLEQIVSQLEDNQIPLEKSIDLFQEGIELSQFCHHMRGSLEEKVAKILVNQQLTDFEEKES